MAIRLASYQPLIYNPDGYSAHIRHNLPPFVDSSCRREPDFESPYPSITALCRRGTFAPHLSPNDIVVYITRKGAYLDVYPPHWRLTAILRVAKRFATHEQAAAWYDAQGIAVPSNCLVPGNGPVPLAWTGRASQRSTPPSPPTASAHPLPMVDRTLQDWDAWYQSIAHNPEDEALRVFLACEPEFVDVWQARVITPETMCKIFGRIPGTQNPAKITENDVDALRSLCS